MNKERIKIICESALAVALCVAFNFIQIRLPINLAGGSISLVMLPIAIVALRRGPGVGALIGLVFGIIDLLIDPYIVHWVQIILDYPLPYLLFGFGVGLFKPLLRAVKKKGAKTAVIIISFLIGGALRFCSHLVSGVIFFGSSAPVDQNVWLWSGLYQCSYLLPSLIAVCILTIILVPVLEKVIPSQPKDKQEMGEERTDPPDAQ